MTPYPNRDEYTYAYPLSLSRSSSHDASDWAANVCLDFPASALSPSVFLKNKCLAIRTFSVQYTESVQIAHIIAS